MPEDTKRRLGSLPGPFSTAAEAASHSLGPHPAGSFESLDKVTDEQDDAVESLERDERVTITCASLGSFDAVVFFDTLATRPVGNSKRDCRGYISRGRDRQRLTQTNGRKAPRTARRPLQSCAD